MDSPHERGMEGVMKASMTLMEERARSYQIELFEYAKKNNTIVCLGTGTGKTFISVLLVKHLEHEVIGRWLEVPGKPPVGKRTIFLAPGTALVEQQGAVLAQHMTVKVGTYIGAQNADQWTNEQWNKELEKNGVLVMTPEIFRKCIHHAFIPLENVNLLIIDECHNATKDHPYVTIMKFYKDLPVSARPKVLGLTASVVNAQGFQVARKIRELEACLFSTAKTAAQSAVVQFGTKPTEIIVVHETHDAENTLPINRDKLRLLEKCADFKEFNRTVEGLAKTYASCGPFCAKELLEFRQRELEKALNLPDCADGFREHAPIKMEMYDEIRQFLGESPSQHDTPPKMKSLLEILKQFKDVCLSAIVFVRERLVAYALYLWMTQLSREDEYSFVNCSFIVGQRQKYGGNDNNDESLMMNSKAQNKVMKDFRSGFYNLLFATSVIEEGMDVPACNLIVRFDPPLDVRSYIQSKGRARAKPSLYVVMSAENDLEKRKSLMGSFQETEQLVTLCCGTERSMPPVYESFEVLKEDPDMPPYIVQHARARIEPQNAVSLVHAYCQQFTRMKYSNVFPHFDFEETPEGFVCTLEMPMVCPLRVKLSNETRPFISKDKAKMFVCLEMCKRLHQCGELADNLLPRRRFISLHKLPTSPQDVRAEKELKEAMAVTGPKSREKRRYVLPRKRSDLLQLKEENEDCDPSDEYHLYVIKTEVVTWSADKQNWRKENLFDPVKYPKWLGILMRSESPKMKRVPCFPIFTRSGEEKVSFVYAGPVSLDANLKQLCSRFNRYTFSLVLYVTDNFMLRTENFSTPNIVPVKELEGGRGYELELEVLSSIGPAKLPNFSNFVFKDEDYEDAVVELLYHLDENQKQLRRDVHSKVPLDCYHKFYITKTRTNGPDGQPLTPQTTGFYGFDKSLSFADYAFKRTLRAGTRELLKAFQPVMTVEHIQRRLNMLKPRFENQQQHRIKYELEPTLTYLLPQFVAIHAIKASLWRKITSLPSILYRLDRLLIAEDIRQDISLFCHLKQVDPDSHHWPPMKYEHKVKEKIKETPAREFDALVREGDRNYDASKLLLPVVEQPHLKSCEGPSPIDLMKALTTKACMEYFDLERLELLGDSFLQIVATFWVLDSHKEKSISELNTLRQYQVNNRHLLYRAHEKELTGALEAQQFVATHNYLPFGFRPLPHEEKLLHRDFLCLFVESFGFDVASEPLMKDLRFARLAQELLKDITNEDPVVFLESVKCTTITDDALPMRHNVPVKSFHDIKAKIGGDVVEALAGLYLEKCGPVGALRFFRWIGKNFGDTDSNNFLDAFQLDFRASQEVPAQDLKPFMFRIEKVEKQIGYSFTSKGLVLQAITHHSCRDHLLTEDNSKLAFIGEAVVDYLLTLYIYGISSNLNPGQLTDLRCALINNQVSAHAIVRSDLHTVLLYSNNQLFSAIRNYLGKIEDIGLRLNTALGDWETDDTEEAEVPRPFARILQSIMGAVFIDSNKSFETVWRILLNIMGFEISLFTNNIPITPVKELCQLFPGTSFSKPTFIHEGEDEGKLEVKMYVNVDGQTETYAQISESKKLAKLTLAKRYLRMLERRKRFEEVEKCKKLHVTHESVLTMSDVLLNGEVDASKYYRRTK